MRDHSIGEFKRMDHLGQQTHEQTHTAQLCPRCCACLWICSRMFYVNRKERNVSNARWWISVHEKDLMKKLSNTRWVCWQYTSFQTPSKVDIKNLILFLLRAVCDDCGGTERETKRLRKSHSASYHHLLFKISIVQCTRQDMDCQIFLIEIKLVFFFSITVTFRFTNLYFICKDMAMHVYLQ